LVGSVRSLGQALLGAMEKRDAEALSMLRQTHERALLDAVRGVREEQVSEAERNRDALEASRATAEARRAYYEELLQAPWSRQEKLATKLTQLSVKLDSVAAGVTGAAAGMAYLPETAIGMPGHLRTGGSNLSGAMSLTGSAISGKSGALKTESGRVSTAAGYARRAQEWQHQQTLAEKEL